MLVGLTAGRQVKPVVLVVEHVVLVMKHVLLVVKSVVNRPGVAGAFLQKALFVKMKSSQLVTDSAFVIIYSKHCLSQTVRTR